MQGETIKDDMLATVIYHEAPIAKRYIIFRQAIFPCMQAITVIKMEELLLSFNT